MAEENKEVKQLVSEARKLLKQKLPPDLKKIVQVVANTNPNRGFAPDKVGQLRQAVQQGKDWVASH